MIYTMLVAIVILATGRLLGRLASALLTMLAADGVVI